MGEEKKTHAHHHEHEEGCCCGHEHHHKEHEHHAHHHEHGEDCCCGHEHHHEEHEHHSHHHEHGEGCCCGHEHHHEEQEHHHRHVADNIPRKVYIIENIDCANCAAKMEKKINELPGVEDATITFATKQLRLAAKNPDALLPKIREICTSIESQVVIKEQKERKRETHTEENHGKRDLFAIIFGAVLFAAGKIMENMGIGNHVTIPVYIIAYVILGGEIVVTAAKNLLKGHVFDENFLMSIATLGAFVIHEYPEAVGVMLFYRIGEYFEHRAVERSRSQIMDAVDMRPETVNRIQGENITEIPAEEAKEGDILLVRPGDRIPLDGVIIDGESRLDTSPVTGEPVPVSIKKGSHILSGCVNLSGQLKLQVEKTLSESMVTRILDSVENAAASKPKIDRFITRFARVYTPFVVTAALITAIVPSLFTGNWEHWIYTALTFLVISCPCALVLSVPLAFFSGIGAGSKKGILFKGGVSLEQLADVKAVVMDKTGTVTEGNFVVQKVVPASHWSEEEILKIAAECEQISTHPIAMSIVQAAREKEISLTKPQSLEEIAGHGIKAVTEKGTIIVGNRKLMEKEDISLSSYKNQSFGSEVLVSVNGTFAGHLVISDTVKKDAKSSIAKINRFGAASVMLTGDSLEEAEAVARVTGIQEVHARLLPEDKVTELQNVRKKYESVMFVGDGINDAPVLAGADVGAAMGSGADAAIEAADVVFMNSSMESIPEAMAIAKATKKIAWQNVVFALIIKAIVMVLGLAGFASMWLAVFADSGVAMLCVFNSIRILYKKQKN